VPGITFKDELPLPAFCDNERAINVWGAAIIDGEGSIGCSWCFPSRLRKPAARSQVVVQLSEKGMPVLRLLFQLFGCGYVTQRRAAVGGRTAAYAWSVYGPKVIPFLTRIEPYLVLKREQAKLVIEIETRRAALPWNTNNHGGKVYDEEFIAYADRLIDKMHDLNWTGSVPRELAPNRCNARGAGRPRGSKNGDGKFWPVAAGTSGTV